MKLFSRLVLIGFTLTFVGATAVAQSDASRIVVGFPPGGAVDIVARMVAEKLRSSDENFIVDNRPGAQGRLGLQAVKDSKPDGRTLLATPGPVLTLFPHTFKRVAYDPFKDLVAVAPLVKWSIGLAVAADSPQKNLADVIRDARAAPQSTFFGTAATGNVQHFLGIRLAQASGAKLELLGFKGGPEAVTALIGHQIPIVILNTSEMLEMHKAGRVRILVVFSEARSSLLPEVPTIREAGFAELQTDSWAALYAPAGTPPARIEQLNSRVRSVLSNAEIKERIERLGLTVDLSSAAALDAVGKKEFGQWGEAVKAAGFVPE